ncbi:Mot2p [Coprinopsis cinerea okayama7|uniref:Mot2p n=1 Tax=Coprinopsis cinerea (strain Okayama-7 / 130 / ATCC MYA-4618 / FGSC 9003) TaxID=240176 RepID=A8NGA1_COPC7|nr:Mot2p [Coprinopsis cinerea okayama7\|eukprot:XP_001833386.2 Mot2p [Coprinopsis cinerea okayama7\
MLSSSSPLQPRSEYLNSFNHYCILINTSHKRLTQQKKQRDREKKELETLGRKHLANVRVVQRNVVYVVGIGPRFAKEELIPTLRSNEYFGQYGKISKILITKRTPPGGNGPVVGLYITYHRREDAARAIAAVDGAPSPGGGREIMRASYGTTKYCMAFLRNVTCNDHNCMNLHEWGDEKDCFTKEDLTTLKHTMKTTETRSKTASAKKEDDGRLNQSSFPPLLKEVDAAASLPRAASWGQKSGAVSSSSSGTVTHTVISGGLPRGTRRTTTTRQTRHTATSSQTSATARSVAEKKVVPPTNVSTSRPSTPANTSASPAPAPTVSEAKASRAKKDAVSLVRETASPAPSAATESDAASVQPEPQDQQESKEQPEQPAQAEPVSRPTSTGSVQPAPQEVVPIPMVPPGLSAPPGIPSPSRPPRTATDSPQTPLLASASSYQMSTAAKILLDDVQARRQSTVATTGISPFPDFDRTLQTLSESDGGFSFNLDPKLAGGADSTDVLAEFEAEASTPFHGTYLQAFPALQIGSSVPAPPGLGYPGHRSIFTPAPPRTIQPSPLSLSHYMGSFNPFSESTEEPNASASVQPSHPDDDRKVSRFGFARGRQGTSSITSSPALNGTHSPQSSHASSVPPLGLDNLSQSDSHSRWPTPSHPYGLHHMQSSMQSPPVEGQVNPGTRFQPFEAELGEAQLREFIQASRERELQKAALANHQSFKSHQPFSDPAIMSASYGPPPDTMFSQVSYGPPPGLSMPPAIPPGLHMQNSGMVAASDSAGEGGLCTKRRFQSTDSPFLSVDLVASPSAPSAPSPVPSLSAADFPALVSSAPKEESSALATASLVQSKAQEKAARKAAKKAEKQAEKERAKLAREKATATLARSMEDTPSESTIPLHTNKSSKGQQSNAKPEIPTATVEPKAEAATTASTKPAKAEERLSKKAREKGKARAKAAANEPSRTVAATEAQPKQAARPKPPLAPAPIVPEISPEVQVPILSKKPKKNKPVTRVHKPLRDEPAYDDSSRTTTGGEGSSASMTNTPKVDTRSPSKTPDVIRRLSLEELLEQITQLHPPMDLASHPFFDLQRLGSIAKMPLEYEPLVHALSALSVGGGSFANNVPSGSIDTAVTSFQQLLETLTQTISDLLRLLPRTTWDDSSSFDGVLRDMLKGDDFLDETGEAGQERDDEVAALTLALERRARWMEVQLSKLEELHRDINNAAVRAVLSFNDNGWDKEGFLPRCGDTLSKFDELTSRPMTVEELEKKLAVAKEAAAFAEAEVRESMNKLQFVKEFDNGFL